MPYKPRTRAPLLCALLMVAAGSAPAQSFLGMSELRALITGNTVESHRLSDGQIFRNYYAASGDVIVQRPDAVEFSGRWSALDDGSHCVFFAEENCGKIAKNADGSYTRVVGGVSSFKWVKITSGKDF